MKKIISKILIIFIIVVMMFEFIISSNICSASIEFNEETINGITNLAGGIVSIVFGAGRLIAVSLSFVMDLLTAQLARDSGINDSDGSEDLLITPFNIFFNKYKLLDVNFFDIDEGDNDKIVYTFRITVAQWYYVMRLISITILMVILIYVGIRMALSTIADDKAKYKKMLIDWCCSLVLVFILHYIAIFIIYCNDAIVSALKDGITDLSTETQLSGILVDIGLKGVIGIGIESIAAVLVFIFIVFQTISFLIAYINRVLKVGFLLIISPLISLTYSIDKMGDGKAQALGAWLKEFTYTILIQPFHCIMYMAFVRPAISLLTANNMGYASFFSGEYNQLVNGVLAILCLKFINDGEKIVRKIFGFQDDNSSTSMAAGMAVGMMAVKNAQKIGQSARKGINFAKNTGTRLNTAFKNDAIAGKIPIPKLGTKLQEKYRSATLSSIKKKEQNKKEEDGKEKKIGGFKSKLPHNRLKEIAGKKGVKGYLAGKYLQHNSLSSTLGMMGAAMAYSTGSTDALTAIGTGVAIQKGSQEFFSSSKNTLTEQSAQAHRDADDQAFERLNEDISELSEDIDEDIKALEHADEYGAIADEANKYGQKAEKQEEIAKAARERESKLKKGKRRNEERHQAEVAEEKARAYREKEKKLQEKARAMDGSDKLAEIHTDRTGFESRLDEKKKKLEGLREYREKFHNPEEVAKRVADRTKPKDSELQAKKNEIVQRLIALKKASRNSEKDGDTQDIELSVEDMDTINSTADSIIKSIEDRAALPGRGINKTQQMAFVKQQLNLDGDNKKLYQALYKSTSDYEEMERNKHIDSINSNVYKIGIDSESFENSVTGVMIEYNKRQEHKRNGKTQQSSN